MSEIKVNSIKGVGASTAAITVNNTDGSCAVNNTQRQGKNLILNGSFKIAQRGTSSTTSGYGSVDRWQILHNGTDEAPTHAQVDVSSGTTPYTLGFRKALRVTNGNQTSGAGAADYIMLNTRLESQDTAQSGWNYTSTSSFITLSFWVKSSVAQEFFGFLLSSDGTRKLYSFSLGSLSADTWTKVTKTIPGNSELQFDNDTEQGILLRVAMFRGTDNTGTITQNQWSTFNTNVRYPNYTSTWYTTNDATFEVTGFQLEVGSVATDFEHLSFADELRRCQRYFFNITGDNGTKTSVLGYANSSSNVRAVVNFPVPMRANPTFTGSTGAMVFDSSDDSDSFNVNTIAVNSNTTNPNPFQQSIEANPGGMTAGQGGQFEFRANSGFMNFSAEL